MEREERVKERMEKTMKAAKLPPRMQMHMEEKKRKEEEEGIKKEQKLLSIDSELILFLISLDYSKNLKRN